MSALTRSRVNNSWILSLLCLCIFALNSCQISRSEPLCETPVLYNDPIVGRWAVTRMRVEFGGVTIEPSYGVKIGNHWEFTSTGELRREPGQDNQFRILRPGVLIECVQGRTPNIEVHYQVKEGTLAIRIEYEGPDAIFN